MRGKGARRCALAGGVGSTPAYAGKSCHEGGKSPIR